MKTIWKRRGLIFLSVVAYLCICTGTLAQDVVKATEVFRKPDMDKAFQPIVNIETWATYSSREKNETHDYVDRT